MLAEARLVQREDLQPGETFESEAVDVPAETHTGAKSHLLACLLQ